MRVTHPLAVAHPDCVEVTNHVRLAVKHPVPLAVTHLDLLAVTHLDPFAVTYHAPLTVTPDREGLLVTRWLTESSAYQT